MLPLKNSSMFVKFPTLALSKSGQRVKDNILLSAHFMCSPIKLYLFLKISRSV